ncbi:hypothetical protein D0T11_02210 [Hymenobacter rubripertinctus]|uniref:Uncharacterized protein n=1 Tax=Hymenobacter rubripertinctus TaxID=2029981 RepID=A0A418R6R5_9BACT|nr:hypothetical protein D0T11_02210 [Hymenobacter rubripertinctus]
MLVTKFERHHTAGLGPYGIGGTGNPEGNRPGRLLPVYLHRVQPPLTDGEVRAVIAVKIGDGQVAVVCAGWQLDHSTRRKTGEKAYWASVIPVSKSRQKK